MFRRLVGITMFISFIAMSTSGAMMFVLEKPSFTLQMHPVHKTFGLLMVLAAIGHIVLNFPSLKRHLKVLSGGIAGGVLVMLLVVMYGLAINNNVPPDLAQKMDSAAALAESQMKEAMSK